ncbi:uncharacterized protein [Halyomorpha halys]|uniref:uncharacterized protein isoform X1 n=2 Tax=Halyomorpha halys TaxID=286706 RepID=UPI0034D38614
MPYEYYCKTKPSKPKFQVCPELDTENTAECESGARAAFIISDEALQKLVNKTEGKDYSVKKGTISKVFEEQEQQWRNKELCIDKLHAEKVGIDEKSIEVMEKNWKTSESELDTKNKPLLDCYQANMLSPLKCKCLVLDYLQTVAKHREDLFSTRT